MRYKRLFSISLIILTFSIIITLVHCTNLEKISKEGSLTLHSVEIDGEPQQYYLYLPSQEPIGVILVIPPLGGNHETYLIGANWGSSEGNMTESPLVRTAKIYNLALIFTEGSSNGWYAPDDGEKKVLRCMEDANNTFLKLNRKKWFIYGFSMGGAGTITITVRHPNLFSGLFSGGGLPDLTNDMWIAHYSRWWPCEELIQTASPQQHLEVFYNRTIFLACGTADPIFVNYDNFSQILDTHGIRHYYYRGNEGHTNQILLETMNQTFNMFSHHLFGTLDTFFEDYTSPLTPITISKSTQWSDNSSLVVIIVFFTIRVCIKYQKGRR
ncbi:MAG: prolyl oligopeptidase family serine peptidase [Promethearchaeota archaeon]